MTANNMPTPLTVAQDGNGHLILLDNDLNVIVRHDKWHGKLKEAPQENMDFIVTACNAHDTLVETLRLALMELTRPSDTKRVIVDILKALKLAGEEV